MRANITFFEDQKVTLSFDPDRPEPELRVDGEPAAVGLFEGMLDHFEGHSPVSGLFQSIDRTAPDQIHILLAELEKDPAFQVEVVEALDYTFPELPEEFR